MTGSIGLKESAGGAVSKPIIVISGVNLVDLGPLSIYKDALRSLVKFCAGRYEIVALVHRSALLGVDGVTYLEFPGIKGSSKRRLQFEYFDSLELSRRLKPTLWIAMHDMTPRVVCPRQVVYCHNPSPFYRFSVREAMLDPKFGLFTLFYRFIYRLFLQRNEAVIVQQQWIRQEFEKRFGAKRVIVATPTVEIARVAAGDIARKRSGPYRFFYPAFSRTFKNHELLLEAIKILEERGVAGFEILLTVDSTSNRCGANLVKKYGALRSIKWLGGLLRDRVYELYGETDCLVFPSKLETWGLPLTEFKTTGKSILAADLPYAHEAIGSYDNVSYFDVKDPVGLADRLAGAINGTLQWQTVTAASIDEPYARDWAQLWSMLLTD